MTGEPADGETLHKVTGFVVRGGADLLVFRHPSAGVQIPAGTVELDEPLDEAVLREVREEGGLSAVRIVRRLESFAEVLPPEVHAFSRRVWVRAEPGSGARLPIWARRGIAARVVERVDGFVRVEQEGRTGWVPADALTRRLERHLYHLETTEPTGERWRTRTDGHTFRLYWVSLTGDHGLHPFQAAWLARVRDRLIAP